LRTSFKLRIAAKQGKFRRIDNLTAYSHRAKDSHPIQSFQSTVLVAKAGKDQGLLDGA
jgi:hypothetical protein